MKRMAYVLSAIIVAGSLQVSGWQRYSVNAENPSPVVTPGDRAQIEIVFPPGSVGGKRAEIWLNRATLSGGVSAPYPGTGMTQDGVAVLVVEQGSLELSGDAQIDVIPSGLKAATPIALGAGVPLEPGDAAAIAFGPNTVPTIRNGDDQPATLLSGLIFGERAPAGGPPAVFNFVDAFGPIRVPIPETKAPVVQLERQTIQPSRSIPAPGTGMVQLAIGAGSIVMRSDGSAHNISDTSIEVTVLTVRFEASTAARPEIE